MEDDNKDTEVSSVWDLPSLTSSVYPSPLFRRGFDPIYLPGYGDVSNDQQGTHPGLFTDGFVFPPSEHENLPVELELDELNTNNDGKEGSAEINDEWCHVEPEEVDDLSDENLSYRSDLPSANETTLPDSTATEKHAKQEKDHTLCKSDLPCEGWWKRKSTYLFHRIKGVTTVCSVVAAGAVVGFVIMGQRFQQDNWHLHQFHLSVSSESLSRVIGIFSRLKDGLPGGEQLRSLLPTRVLPQQQMSA
uniref:ATG8-interacting protein 1 n=1 Tax=Arundo donax TaxID=35708 RepID=A0A0A9F819_ARUDO